MRRWEHLDQCAVIAVVCCSFATHAAPSDLTGVWTTNVPQCEKIFVKKGTEVLFAKNFDIYGNSFIIEGNRIKAKTATCNIRSRREEGSVTHLVAACATEIMLLDTLFSMRLVDNNTLERMYLGVPELDSRYGRCKM